MRFRKKQGRKPTEKTKPRKGRIRRAIGKFLLYSYLGCYLVGGASDATVATFAKRKFNPIVEKHLKDIKRGNFAERLEKKLIEKIAKAKGLDAKSLEGKVSITPENKDWLNKRIAALTLGKNVNTTYTTFEILWTVFPQQYSEEHGFSIRNYLRGFGMIFIYPVLSPLQIVYANRELGVTYSMGDINKKLIYIQPIPKYKMFGSAESNSDVYRFILFHEVAHYISRSKGEKDHREKMAWLIGERALFESKIPDSLKVTSRKPFEKWLRSTSPQIIIDRVNDFFSKHDQDNLSESRKP
jgi:hypothetical protein